MSHWLLSLPGVFTVTERLLFCPPVLGRRAAAGLRVPEDRFLRMAAARITSELTNEHTTSMGASSRAAAGVDGVLGLAFHVTGAGVRMMAVHRAQANTPMTYSQISQFI